MITLHQQIDQQSHSWDMPESEYRCEREEMVTICFFSPSDQTCSSRKSYPYKRMSSSHHFLHALHFQNSDNKQHDIQNAAHLVTGRRGRPARCLCAGAIRLHRPRRSHVAAFPLAHSLWPGQCCKRQVLDLGTRPQNLLPTTGRELSHGK